MPVWSKQAAGLAEKWGASVLGLLVGQKVVRRNYYHSSVGYGLGELQVSVEKKRQALVLDLFNEVLQVFNVQSQWMLTLGDPVVETHRTARYADLAVLGYPDKTADDLSDLQRIVEHVAIESGCPALVVPSSFKTEIETDRITVCWDGGREAVRA